MRAILLTLMLGAGMAHADVLPLAIGYAVGRSSAPGAPAPGPGTPLAAGTPKCFVQIGTVTVDAFQVISITHVQQGSNYPCRGGQWLNTVGLANGQQVSACTLDNPQVRVLQAMEKCK